MEVGDDGADSQGRSRGPSHVLDSDRPGPPPVVAIVVFARLPVPGRVKTRLAAGAGVGPNGACDFYKACAEHAISQAASCSYWAQVSVYHSSGDNTADVASWLAGEGLLGHRLGGGGGGVQGRASDDAAAAATATVATTASSCGLSAPEPDLGAKMLAAMSEALHRSFGAVNVGKQQKGKVLIMGTDIPDITGQLLRRAADALDEHEVVIGPSLDGGYYLLGLTRLEPRIFQSTLYTIPLALGSGDFTFRPPSPSGGAASCFQDMQWSTDRVLRDTLERAAAAGLRVAPLDCLPPLRDVDTVQDLAEWVSMSRPPSSSLQPHSTEVTEPEVDSAGGVLSVAGGPMGGGALSRRRQCLLMVSRRVLERAAVAVVEASANAAVVVM
ncbi:hypothetical protein VOLCADRAFT_91086 [Volvox carteri f. nagariensis]|uniref:Glycosyltransferase n=1 Tax=Volvox carteri f. nagariensis TaxID=3068 RepID=D8TW51_VOLCA|nr:uncharacterized protein VOLCADRAFT_91086 [Volvox carteri f. nagariensis]EFJ48418.1 hypothetical protein VOLCADRAFT_91086 [Volvox carteri f. nagariensis]|eukprot:XP_002950672.1 hypothetical protein VOLCADRAFT_91086 [Volvox carteri f. nagariensis]